MRQHLFHGAHDPGKLAGVAEVRIHPETPRGRAGRHASSSPRSSSTPRPATRSPRGSAEERVLWLHVEAKDAKGKTLPPAGRPQGLRGRGVHHRLGHRARLPGHRRHQGDRRASPASSATGPTRDGRRRPHLPPALPRPEGADDDRAVEHRRASAPTTGWRRSQAVAETFTWKLPQDLPPGRCTVTAERLLLAAGLLGGRVPEGAGRGVRSR